MFILFMHALLSVLMLILGSLISPRGSIKYLSSSTCVCLSDKTFYSVYYAISLCLEKMIQYDESLLGCFFYVQAQVKVELFNFLLKYVFGQKLVFLIE